MGGQESKGDAGDPISRAVLAHWYLESYRETGEGADITRAEQAARASLAIRTRNNDAAFLELSRALAEPASFRRIHRVAAQARGGR